MQPADGQLSPRFWVHPQQALGVSSQVAKALSSVDGQAYVLRRVDGRQASLGRFQGAGEGPGLHCIRHLCMQGWGFLAAGGVEVSADHGARQPQAQA